MTFNDEGQLVTICKSELATRPVSYSDVVQGEQVARDDMWMVSTTELNQLHDDAMTLALRLMGEDEDTFAPETREVMSRWRPKCMALFEAQS